MHLIVCAQSSQGSTGTSDAPAAPMPPMVCSNTLNIDLLIILAVFMQFGPFLPSDQAQPGSAQDASAQRAPPLPFVRCDERRPAAAVHYSFPKETCCWSLEGSRWLYLDRFDYTVPGAETVHFHVGQQVTFLARTKGHQEITGRVAKIACKQRAGHGTEVELLVYCEKKTRQVKPPEVRARVADNDAPQMTEAERVEATASAEAWITERHLRADAKKQRRREIDALNLASGLFAGAGVDGDKKTGKDKDKDKETDKSPTGSTQRDAETARERKLAEQLRKAERKHETEYKRRQKLQEDLKQMKDENKTLRKLAEDNAAKAKASEKDKDKDKDKHHKHHHKHRTRSHTRGRKERDRERSKSPRAGDERSSSSDSSSSSPSPSPRRRHGRHGHGRKHSQRYSRGRSVSPPRPTRSDSQFVPQTTQPLPFVLMPAPLTQQHMPPSMPQPQPQLPQHSAFCVDAAHVATLQTLAAQQGVPLHMVARANP